MDVCGSPFTFSFCRTGGVGGEVATVLCWVALLHMGWVDDVLGGGAGCIFGIGIHVDVALSSSGAEIKRSNFFRIPSA